MTIAHAGPTTPTTSLTRMLEQVHAARRTLVEVRADRANRHTDTRAARHDLMLAIEAYVGAVTASGAPVPYRLRDELRLCRTVDRLG